MQAEITRYALDRVPLSLIIDDSTLLVNLNYFFMRDRNLVDGQQRRWEDVPVVHPESFTREFAPRGLAVVAINSNDVEAYPQDGPDGMRQEAAEHGYVFPYLLDESQAVAKAYRAACTPDFFLFDAGRRLVYRGQFDDSRPNSGIPVTGASLRACRTRRDFIGTAFASCGGSREA